MKTLNSENQELLFVTSNETETILLCNFCEHIADIHDKDLFKHKQHIEALIAENCKSSPHQVAQNIELMGLINDVFLIAAQYGPVAKNIYETLRNPISQL